MFIFLIHAIPFKFKQCKHTANQLICIGLNATFKAHFKFGTYHKKSYHSHSIRLTSIWYFLYSQRAHKRVHKPLCIFYGKHPFDRRPNDEVHIWICHLHRHHHKESCHVRRNLKWECKRKKQKKFWWLEHIYWLDHLKGHKLSKYSS